MRSNFSTPQKWGHTDASKKAGEIQAAGGDGSCETCPTCLGGGFKFQCLPTLVEVRGVEPRSAEFFVSNSPSAATGWLSAGGITAAVSHRPIRNGAWPGGPGIPPGASRFSDALIRRGGNPPDRTGYLSIRQPAPFVVWHLFCLPGCFARFRKPRLASDTAITQRRIQVTPMSSRYRHYINPLRHPPPGLSALAETRDGGPPGGDPSPSPGAARVRGSPVACPPCCGPWRAQPPAWPSRP